MSLGYTSTLPSDISAQVALCGRDQKWNTKAVDVESIENEAGTTGDAVD